TADLAPPFSWLMGWAMKIKFDQALTDAVNDFRHYAETGEPSELKRKVDQSKKAIRSKTAFS
ncbi:MAG: hypothetical protein AAF610_05835, partial [Pseudomonadota bacterium]